jgi:hypothetical protein
VSEEPTNDESNPYDPIVLPIQTKALPPEIQTRSKTDPTRVKKTWEIIATEAESLQATLSG